MADIHLSFDSLVWISSLYPDEKGASARIRDDVFALFSRNKKNTYHFEPKNRADFRKTLYAVEHIIKRGEKPLIHIDMHGSKVKGLFLCESNSYFSWDWINKKISKLNCLMKNQLVIISCACWGMQILNEIRIDNPCPYRCIIAPEKEVESGYLEDNLNEFYSEMMLTHNLQLAYGKIKKKFRILSAEEVAFPIFVNFVVKLLSDRRKIRDETWNYGGFENSKSLPQFRSFVRSAGKELSDPDSAINKKFISNLIDNFMHYQNTHLFCEDVIDKAKEIYRKSSQ